MATFSELEHALKLARDDAAALAQRLRKLEHAARLQHAPTYLLEALSEAESELKRHHNRQMLYTHHQLRCDLDACKRNKLLELRNSINDT